MENTTTPLPLPPTLSTSHTNHPNRTKSGRLDDRPTDRQSVSPSNQQGSLTACCCGGGSVTLVVGKKCS